MRIGNSVIYRIMLSVQRSILLYVSINVTWCQKWDSPPRSFLVLTERGTILRRNKKDLLLILPCQNCPYLKDNCSDYDDLQTNFNENLCEYSNDSNRHQGHRTRAFSKATSNL